MRYFIIVYSVVDVLVPLRGGLTKSRAHDRTTTAQSIRTTTARTLLLRPWPHIGLYPVPHIPVDHRATIAQSAQALNFYVILLTFHLHILLFTVLKFDLILIYVFWRYILHLHLPVVTAVCAVGCHSAVADCYRQL